MLHGAIAQLVEHLNGIEGVSGSSPLSSINTELIQPLHKGYIRSKTAFIFIGSRLILGIL